MSDFERFHLEEHRKLSRTMESLAEKIDSLNEFKWKQISAAATISVIISGAGGLLTLIGSLYVVYSKVN